MPLSVARRKEFASPHRTRLFAAEPQVAGNRDRGCGRVQNGIGPVVGILVRRQFSDGYANNAARTTRPLAGYIRQA